MGGCCSSSDDEGTRRRSKSLSPAQNSKNKKAHIPDIIDLDAIQKRDLNKWDAEDCDAYSRDEQYFEEELNFSKRDIVNSFHSQLNTFMSLLRQKVEENNELMSAQKSGGGNSFNNNNNHNKNNNNNEGDSTSATPIVSRNQSSCMTTNNNNEQNDDIGIANEAASSNVASGVTSPSNSNNRLQPLISFHINTQESSIEQQLVDVKKLQKMFTIATAFGRFSDAKFIHRHFIENVRSKTIIDDANNSCLMIHGCKTNNNNINSSINATSPRITTLNQQQNSASANNNTNNNNNNNELCFESQPASTTNFNTLMGEPNFSVASAGTTGQNETETNNNNNKSNNNHNNNNNNSSSTSPSPSTQNSGVTKRKRIRFNVDLPLKPFFPYNGRVQQWNALQWALAIQTQRHLNEFFHEKSERLAFLNKEKGDFVLSQMTREEQNKCVGDFVKFLLEECKADVNCEATRRGYEREGRLRRMQGPRSAIDADGNLNKSDMMNESSEPFSPPTNVTSNNNAVSSSSSTAKTGSMLIKKSGSTIDSRYDLQHDAQDYCHRDHPLFLAVEATNDVAVLELCKLTHCVVNPFNKTKDTPLAVFCDTFRVVNRESVKRANMIIRTLIKNCADVNNENNDDSTTSFASVRTPLDFATIHGSVELCEILVHEGAEWKKTNQKLSSLMQDFMKWNYGTRSQVEEIRKFFDSLVKNKGKIGFGGPMMLNSSDLKQGSEQKEDGRVADNMTSP